MLSAPDFPILVSVLCERCLNKNNTREITSDVSEVLDWSAIAMLSAPDTSRLFTVT